MAIANGLIKHLIDIKDNNKNMNHCYREKKTFRMKDVIQHSLIEFLFHSFKLHFLFIVYSNVLK